MDTPGSRWYETYFGPDYLIIDIQYDTDREVAFLREVLELHRGSRLLDVACGYGRHLVPLVKKGVRVVGCDLSAFMLAEAKRRLRRARIRHAGLVRCNARSLPFEGVFDATCCMFNSFGYFAAEDDNFRMLQSIAAALRPGGRFLLDLANRDSVIRTLSCSDWHEKGDALILERKWFDPLRSRSEIDVHIVDKTGKRSYHHSIRMYAYTELSMLLEAAGLGIEAVFGEVEGEPFDTRSNRMLILDRATEGDRP